MNKLKLRNYIYGVNEQRLKLSIYINKSTHISEFPHNVYIHMYIYIHPYADNKAVYFHTDPHLSVYIYI